jgi:hypothetical protein
MAVKTEFGADRFSVLHTADFTPSSILRNVPNDAVQAGATGAAYH